MGEHCACAKGKIAFDFGDGHRISKIAIYIIVAVEIDVLRELRAFVQDDIGGEHGIGLCYKCAAADIIIGIIDGNIGK